MKFTKKLMFLVVFSLLVVKSGFAGVIDLADGYNGKKKRKFLKTIDNGESIQFDFRGRRAQYVEKIMITAVGKQRNYSFGKVYVDGEEVATLGVPGRDPVYPIVVRGYVSTIEVAATEGSRFKVTGFKIYTTPKKYNSYSSRRSSSRHRYSVEDWGSEVLDIVYELDTLFCLASSPDAYEFTELKKKAMRVSASERVRDERSLKTFKKVKALMDVILEVEEILLDNDALILGHSADVLITDLLTVKEDILERYDWELDQ